MLKLSKTIEYALISINHINQYDKDIPISVKKISNQRNIPFELLAKILQKLFHDFFATAASDSDAPRSPARRFSSHAS